jgi:hypothetical protein
LHFESALISSKRCHHTILAIRHGGTVEKNPGEQTFSVMMTFVADSKLK